MIPLGRSGLALCFWYELGRPDRTTAMSLLQRSEADMWVLSALRGVLEKRLAGTPSRLTDQEVFAAIAEFIAAGELVVVRTDDHTFGPQGDVVPRQTPASASAPPPPAARPASQSSSPPPPPEDPPIFPPNINAAAMAAANQQAAQQGAPFCQH